ncbi:MAG: glycosyltransferase [Candidatus Omnitrophica bacterium]|nr:glycosyltransferase [Candidatus Omnitrophota bacterium]
MKTKVFIIVGHLGSGGTQRQIVEYLKYADRQVFEFKIVSLDDTCNVVKDEISNLGYQVIEIKLHGFFSPGTLFRLWNLFRLEKPHIVHTYLYTSDFYGRLAGKLAAVPVIISSVRNIDAWHKWYHRLADRILSHVSDCIVINAESIRPYLVKDKNIPTDKIVTIHNGIDLKRFLNLKYMAVIKKSLGIPTASPVIGMIGRFSAQKDYMTFFETAKEVHQIFPEAYFLAVGDGPLKERLASSVERLAISKNVIFTGLRKDIPDLINAMDICVLSSHYEGCPNVILEYMACSKPVVASNVGGCAELVIDGETGFIVEPRNASVLADRIIQLLNNNDLRQQMGEKGRKRIESHFSVEKMVAQTETLYRKLTQPRIAYILSQFPVTSETFILREIRALQSRGVNIKIVSLKPCRDKIIHPEARELMRHTLYARAVTFGGLRFSFCYPVRALKTLSYVVSTYTSNPVGLAKALYVWLECLSLADMIKRDGITHIHSHWATMPTTAALILSKLAGIPFSFTAHAWDIFVDSAGLGEKIEKAKFTVTCTEYNRQFLHDIYQNGDKEKIYRNYHGIDIDKFSAIEKQNEDNMLHILSIGRLVETKGFEYLIEACAMLRNKGVPFECTIVGDGPLEAKLRMLVHDERLNNHVKLAGAMTQEEIKQLYCRATVLIQPSVVAKDGDRDGIPNVILEAMAMGIPIIATDLSGIPEAVMDNRSGILVPERDIYALSKAMETVWSDIKLRAVLSQNGRPIIREKFNIEKNIEELINIFEQNDVLMGCGNG